MNDMFLSMEEMGKKAKQASYVLAAAGAGEKNAALEAIASALEKNSAEILEANREDVENARKTGTREAMIDRLRLTDARIESAARGVREVAVLDDPVGRVECGWTRPNGLRISKVRVPLGVVGIIFESRPNVTADAGALTLKSGNACILRGGKEAIRSNIAIARIMRKAVASSGLPEDCIQLVEDTSHESANEMMRLNRYIDVLIPRGGAGLIRSVVEHSTVPVIETGVGNCHVYVDCPADVDMAARIIFNAKASRPSVCNAAETLLVHREIAKKFLPRAAELLRTKNVELRGCAETAAILGDEVKPATEADYETEFLDYILAVRVVADVDEAIGHINRYGSRHSEAIVTENYANAQKFLNRVDAAAVYVNASTRFTDGGEFGLGAEIGISTQKLHARGPMGVSELTTYKYTVYGSGQIR